MHSIWKTKITVDELNTRCEGSLSSRIGIEFTEIGPDFLVARMPLDERTKQPMGILHGGASAALAETVASVAGNYCVDIKEQLCVGLDLNINHMRAVRSGFVEAITRPFHLGARTHVWSIEIFDEKKRLIAVGRQTLMVVGRKEVMPP